MDYFNNTIMKELNIISDKIVSEVSLNESSKEAFESIVVNGACGGCYGTQIECTYPI